MSEHAKYVRNCARGRSKDLSHRSTSLCLVQGTDHLASGRIMMSAGVDVRPVILGSTCHIRSAHYGTPCTSLGHVGSPATFSSLPKNLRELRGDKQSRLKSLPTSNFVQGLQLLVGEGFTSHPVLNGHVPAPADGAPVMVNSHVGVTILRSVPNTPQCSETHGFPERWISRLAEAGAGSLQ